MRGGHVNEPSDAEGRGSQPGIETVLTSSHASPFDPTPSDGIVERSPQ